MENISKISKSFLFVAVLFFVLWLGSYLTRQLYLFQLFEPEDLTLSPYFASQNVLAVLYSSLGLITANIVTYSIFLLFFTLFILTSKINLKKEGWLLVTVLIIYSTAPFEIFLLTFDFNIVLKLLSEKFGQYEMLTLIKERITMLGSFPLAEIFSYIFVIFLVLFQPFRLKQNEN